MAAECDGDDRLPHGHRRGAGSDLRLHFHMDGDPSDWRADESVEVLRPERAFEGADLPATPSKVGAIDIRVNELRDPDIFIDNDGTVYMPYSIAGEAGIALAKIG